ncbi:MAG: pantoate--beta-alanine ligase [Candidatus Omnitrophota bacterium]
MRLIRKIKTMQILVRKFKEDKKTIGFVPTMGYLHEGHLSLARQARKDTDVVVMSIYVNPLQFGPQEDFREYPRDLKRDMHLAKGAGVDIIFAPEDKDMYPQDYVTYVEVEKLTEGLCGRFRPGHFKGVTTVVTKLFNIVRPDIAYFGQKDAQQARIIEKMVEDLNMDIKIKVMPIVREKDGLAMSSRNVYLDTEERKRAVCLYQALKKAEEMVYRGERDAEKIISEMKKIVAKGGVSRIDYIEIVECKTLKPVRKIKGKVLVALAVWMDKTRLIDNIIINIKKILK